MRDLLESHKKGHKQRKSVGKKRCYACYLGFDKSDSGQGCSDCKKLYHKECIARHNCEIYKLDDGLSFISELN